MNSDYEKLKEIYQNTLIKRVPLVGYVADYHSLPFTLVGPNESMMSEKEEDKKGTIKLSGKINVSPKMIFSLSRDEEQYDEAFPEEEEFMDKSLVGKIFSFGIANRRNLKIKNEYLNIEEMPHGDQELLQQLDDEFAQAEKIDTGLIWCPRPRFYPVSLERFIYSILDREFK